MITRNEEAAIKKVITDIRRYISGAEILIVDSSTDKTAAIAIKYGVRVVRQYPPKGYGPAMELALQKAKKEIIITMDCDNTYPASAIPLLFSKINEGYDVVGASRLSYGRPKNLPLLNYIANIFFNWLASLFFLRRIQDIHTGMRAYKKKVIQSIYWGTKGYIIPGLGFFKSGARGNAFPVELLLKPINLGYKFVEIPINYRQRLGVSKMEWFDSAVWTLIRIINSRLTWKIKKKR